MKKLTYILLFFIVATNCNAQKNNYKLVIKFGSMCCGVPSNQPVLNYISTFKKNNKIKKITYDHIGPMGKEGEYDMAFSCKELKKKQLIVFVNDVKKLAATLKDQGYATAEENVEVDVTSLGRASITKNTL